MWNPFRRPTYDLSRVIARLDEHEKHWLELVEKYDKLTAGQKVTDSVAIDTQQDQRKLLRQFTSLEVDMAGLADKLSRQLRRITTRAAGAPPAATPPDEFDLEPEDPEVDRLYRNLAARGGGDARLSR